MDQAKLIKARKAGLARRREIASNRAEMAKKMLAEGMGVRRIAEHFGVKPRTIQKDLKK